MHVTMPTQGINLQEEGVYLLTAGFAAAVSALGEAI